MNRFLAVTAAAVLMAAAAVFTAAVPALAAEVSVTQIDYSNSTITVQMKAEDSMLYISDGKQKKWEYVPVVKADDNTVTFDISWIKSTKDYVLSLKGDASTDPIKVTIPKQITSFKAVYNPSEGTVTFTGADNATVEWKKKNGMRWMAITSQEDFKNKISSMIPNGATILLRIAPVNGTGANPGSRPSKELSLAIPKKSAAPTITINDSWLTISLVKGMEYRYTDKDGTVIDENSWVEVTENADKPLEEFASKSMAAVDPEDTYVQFRTKATASKQISNITTVRIPARQMLTNEEKGSCKLEYRSSTTFAIKAEKASSTNPYEYCIINADDIEAGITLRNHDEIKWHEIASTAEVIISQKKDNVDNSSEVYIRRKAYKSLGNDEYRLASDAMRLAVITYPGDVSAAEGTEMKSIAGVCNKDNPGKYMTFVLYSPSESNISAIRFDDGTHKVQLSSSDFRSTVALNNDQSDPDRKYLITTTIMSTAAIDQYAQSFDSNGSTVNSGLFTVLYTIGASAEVEKDKSLVSLQLYGASKVNNPSGTAAMEEIAAELSWNGYTAYGDRIGYTTEIERIFQSNRIYGTAGYEDFRDADQNEFKFKIDFGTPKNPVAGNDEDVAVKSIMYDNVVLANDGSNYKAEYCTKTDASGREIRYAVITLYADEIEKTTTITARDTAEKLIVSLNNGEVIDSVTMKLIRCATLSKNSTGRTIAITEIPAEKTVTVTNGETTETVTEPNKDYMITLDILDGYEGLTVMDVTWAGESILLDADGSSVWLSVRKMKDASDAVSPTGPKTEQVNIIFNNGYSIKRGYILTLTRPNS